MARVRDGSAPSSSTTSAAMYADGVTTYAPRWMARRTRPGYRSEDGAHISGNRTVVRSWTETTSAAWRVGGTTKLLPCTTSPRPVPHSAVGQFTADHIRTSGDAGIGSGSTSTPHGTAPASRPRPRHV